MHILLAVLGVLGAGACWWCRARQIGEAASAIADAAGRTRGYYRRQRFRTKAEASPIAAIDDPRTAAVVMMAAIACSGGRLSDAAEAEIRSAMRDVMGVQNPDEEFAFAKWAAAEIADINNLVTRFSRLWLSRLDESERLALYRCCSRVANADGEPDAIKLSALLKLRDRLAMFPA